MSYLRDKFKMFMSMTVEVIVAAALQYKGILTTQEGNTAINRRVAANSLYCISTSGNSNNPRVNTTTTLNTSLVKVATAITYPANRYGFTAAANDNYIMFAGGLTDRDTSSDIVEVFDNVLTKQRAPVLSIAVKDATGVNVGEYILIAGGNRVLNGRDNYRNYVNAYDATLTKSTPTSLSVTRTGGAGIKFTDKALIIGGGNNSTSHSSTDTYNSSLVRGVGPVLSTGGNKYSVLVGDNLMVFHNGETGPVESYDSTFTRTTLSNLPSTLNNQPVSVGANNEFCIVTTYTSTTVYDSTLTRTDLITDIGALRNAGGASFNGTGLVYPGRVDNATSNDIYYFQYN